MGAVLEEAARRLARRLAERVTRAGDVQLAQVPRRVHQSEQKVATHAGRPDVVPRGRRDARGAELQDLQAWEPRKPRRALARVGG